jgi:hypothetical protein
LGPTECIETGHKERKKEPKVFREVFEANRAGIEVLH